MPSSEHLSSDGSRHDEVDELTAEFMFGLLDYETWNIYLGARWIGQVTFNAADRTAEFTAGDAFSPAYSWMERRNLNNWRNWLHRHEVPRGQHRTAF